MSHATLDKRLLRYWGLTEGATTRAPKPWLGGLAQASAEHLVPILALDIQRAMNVRGARVLITGSTNDLESESATPAFAGFVVGLGYNRSDIKPGRNDLYYLAPTGFIDKVRAILQASVYARRPGPLPLPVFAERMRQVGIEAKVYQKRIRELVAQHKLTRGILDVYLAWLLQSDLMHQGYIALLSANPEVVTKMAEEAGRQMGNSISSNEFMQYISQQLPRATVSESELAGLGQAKDFGVGTLLIVLAVAAAVIAASYFLTMYVTTDLEETRLRQQGASDRLRSVLDCIKNGGKASDCLKAQRESGRQAEGPPKWFWIVGGVAAGGVAVYYLAKRFGR